MENGFLNGFQTVSKSDQIQKILTDVGGEDHFDPLLWNTLEGFQLQPIYHRTDVEVKQPFTSSVRPWKLGQYILFTSLDETLARIKDALANEVEILFCVVGEYQQFIPKIIDSLKGDTIKVYFLFATAPKQNIIDLANQYQSIEILFDALGQYAQKGNWEKSEEIDLSQLNQLFQRQSSAVFFIDATIYANSGGNAVQQNAFALLQLNEYLTHFSTLEKQEMVEVIVRMAQGSSYFMEMAKLIVFRTLANTIIAEYDFPVTLSIIAEPQQRNKTRIDYNVNLLRNATEIMSAILGEADVVMNHPYDLRFNLPNHFSDRMARNQLLILKHESYFDQLPKVTEGAYFVETLINEIKQASWTLFLRQEEAGGWLHQIQNNEMQRQITLAREKEQQRIDCGETTIVGVNKYFDENTLSAALSNDDVCAKETSIAPIELRYTTP